LTRIRSKSKIIFSYNYIMKTKTTEVIDFSISSKELINGDKLHKLLDHYHTIVPKKETVNDIDGFKIDQSYVLRNMLGKLKDGYVITNYQYSKTAETHGRQYACRGVSLQSMTKVLRHTLCNGVYRDYDMVNAHPVIALQYLQKKNMSVPYLKEYVQTRDKHINDLMESNDLCRDDVKDTVLSVFNGGNRSYNALQNKTEWIVGFYKEASRIRDTLYKDPEHEDLLKEVKKLKKGNIEGQKRSLANKLWVDIENATLEHCIKWCHSIGLSTEFIVLCFDGFMLPCSENMPEDWAQQLSKYVFEKSGYNVQFSEKLMDKAVDLTQFKAITIYQEANLKVNENDLLEFVENPSDATLAQLFYSAFGKYYKYDGSTWYSFSKHIWTRLGVTSVPAHVRKLTPYITRLYDYEQFKRDENKVTKALDYIQQSRNDKSMLSKLQGFEGITNPEFPSLLDAKPGLVAYSNGVMVKETKKLTDGRPEDMISKANPFDCGEDKYLADEEDRARTRARARARAKEDEDRARAKEDRARAIAEVISLLKEIFGEDNYQQGLAHLAQIYWGGNTEQLFNFWVGSGGNGKSVVKAMMDAILPAYIKNIPKELFTKEKKHANGGEPEIVGLQGQHGGFVVETDEGDVFYSSMFKRLCGSDSMTARLLYSNNSITFVPIFKPVVLTNNLPKFNGVIDDAITRRLRIFVFPYKFVDNPNPNHPEEKQRRYDIDVTSERFRDALTHLLIHAETSYTESQSMIDARMSYIRELNPVSEWWDCCVDLDEPKEGTKAPKCQQYYRATLEDKVSSSELQQQYNEWAMTNGRTMLNGTRFGTCLRQVTTVEKGDIGEKRRIKIVCGYKKYEEEEEDEDEKGICMVGDD
jgi:phage/plasmid-associated DNA primase